MRGNCTAKDAGTQKSEHSRGRISFRIGALLSCREPVCVGPMVTGSGDDAVFKAREDRKFYFSTFFTRFHSEPGKRRLIGGSRACLLDQIEKVLALLAADVLPHNRME